jgi:hypothetical protein
VTVIYGSVYGEIRTTLDLLAALLDPAAPLSPTKFHNSVHNTAAGYVSIATQNRGGNAAMTAGRSTLAMGLLECAGPGRGRAGAGGAGDRGGDLPEPLAAGRSWAPLAAAFALAADGEVGAGPSDMVLSDMSLGAGSRRDGGGAAGRCRRRWRPTRARRRWRWSSGAAAGGVAAGAGAASDARLAASRSTRPEAAA